MSVPVKIVVAEPSLIIRSGIMSVFKRLTSLDIHVFEVADMEQLSITLHCRRPDVLVVNPAFLGMYSLQQLKNESGCKSLKCVALQNALADRTSLRAYDEMISVYDTADQIRDKLTALIQMPVEAEHRETLSVREREIVVCVVKGMTNKQIADTLCISTHTVITHRRNIAAKLQIHSPAGLTIYAIVNKLVELNDIKDTIRTPQE